MSDTVLPPVSFTTGLAPLPDVGELSYSGCTFSSLFYSTINGAMEQDNAGRTTKWFKLTLEVAGIVTLPTDVPGVTSGTTDSVMLTLRNLLTETGGQLRYTGRGFGRLNVNTNQATGNTSLGNDSSYRDLNWGPKPELLHFQPLGGGRSAMIQWRVTTWISQLPVGVGGVLQFNEEISLTFDDENYSGLSIRGTLELGMSRITQANRTVSTTVDSLRQQWMTVVGNAVDLKRFRVTRRNFAISRDKRVMEWEFGAEELPPTVMPFAAPNARGHYRWQPAKEGVAFVQWICSLRCTYTIDKRYPRRTAWFHFVTLLWYRMLHSAIFGFVPVGANPTPATVQRVRLNAARIRRQFQVPSMTPTQATRTMQVALLNMFAQNNQFIRQYSAFLISLAGDEGLYLDAKSVTFEAKWRLFASLPSILLASGMWQYPGMRAGTTQPNYDNDNNAWALSMQDVMGWKGQLRNQVGGDVIVDFGAGSSATIGSIGRS